MNYEFSNVFSFISLIVSSMNEFLLEKRLFKAFSVKSLLYFEQRSLRRDDERKAPMPSGSCWISVRHFVRICFVYELISEES